ncbi:MAG: CheR family methyltransferase [Candidatus Eremiobacterota bacterium]
MNISEDLLKRLSKLIHKKTGLYFPENKWNDLERAVISYAETVNIREPELCIDSLLLSHGKNLNILVEKLTVGETYFLRDMNIFRLLEEKLLPPLMHLRENSGKYLRIWSAGCSTGEEPYSIAIVINRLMSDMREWKLNIIGTDINNSSLEKARRGLYKEWSFRETPLWFKEKYFEKIDRHNFSIRSDIKKTVIFSRLNLAEDIYSGMFHNMDIIFCRNVLMYFSSDIRGKIISRFYDSLSEGGWFIISPSESSSLDGSKFIPVHFPGAILYKKDRNNKFFYMVDKTDTWELQMGQDYILPFEKIKSESFAELTGLKKVEEETCCYMPSDSLSVTVKEETEQDMTEYEAALKLYEKGHYREASEKMEDFFNKGHISSSHTDGMVVLAKSCSNQHNYASAEQWCKKAIEYKKTDRYYYYLLSTILQEQNKIDEAITALKKAIYLDENFIIPYFLMGSLYLKQGKTKEAEKQFENTLSMLDNLKEDAILYDSDGMTAGRLKEIVKIMTGK